MKTIKTYRSLAAWLLSLGAVVLFALPANAGYWKAVPPDGVPGGFSDDICTHITAARDGALYVLSIDGRLERWTKCEGWQQVAHFDGGYADTMIISGNSLYVGGTFNSITPAGGQAISVNNIARLDLTSYAWFPVGDGSISGSDNRVLAITVDANTNVYASLNVSGGAGPGYKENPVPLVKCNGTGAWTEIGNGLSLAPVDHFTGELTEESMGVRALATDGTNIFAGGGFTGGSNSDNTYVPSSGIIKWDGTHWQTMGNTAPVMGVTVGGIFEPYDPRYGFLISSIVVSGTNVFVTGNFEGHHCVRYQGDQCAETAFEPSSAGQGLCRFSTSGNLIDSNFLKIHGFGGEELIGIAFGYALAAQPDGTVYVTGSFDTIDNVAVQHIARWNARWNGANWAMLDSVNGDLKLSGNVIFGGMSLAADSNGVYVVGIFDELANVHPPDGVAIPGVGRWVTGANPDAYYPSAVLSRPILTGSTVSFTITGTPGSFWKIEYSPDLVNWSPVSDWIFLQSGSNSFTTYLPSTGEGTFLFYRARDNCTVSPPFNPFANQVAAGRTHSLAIKPDGAGTVWNWGNNWAGELGNSDCVIVADPSYTPVQTVNFSNAVCVAAGDQHSIALKSDGTVWGWGMNVFGELGVGTPIYYYSYPVQAVGLSNVISIAACGHRSLAVKADGTVWHWGYQDSWVPTKVANFSNAVAVAAGYNHSLILKSDGTVWAWGDNTSGQLGDGTTTRRYNPVPVSTLRGVIAIAAGSGNSYALTADGKVWAWGAGSKNGDGTTQMRKTRVQVNYVLNVVAITAGNANGYALERDNSVWAWGLNNSGQIGNGAMGAYQLRPVPANTSAFTTIALATGSSGIHCLVTASDMILRGWGANGYGQLGDGTAATRTAPVATVNFSTLVAPVVSGDTPNYDDLTWTFSGSDPDHWRVEQYMYTSGTGGWTWQFVENIPGNQRTDLAVGWGNPMRIVGQDGETNNVTQYSNIVCTF